MKNAEFRTQNSKLMTETQRERDSGPLFAIKQNSTHLRTAKKIPTFQPFCHYINERAARKDSPEDNGH
jgi:hypothetical protein